MKSMFPKARRASSIAMLVTSLLVAAPQVADATCGYLSDSFKFSFLKFDKCKLSITAWVCWDGSRVTIARPVSIHPRCNTLAQIDGWHWAKPRERKYWIKSPTHGSKWGRAFHVAGFFSTGSCPVKISWSGGGFTVDLLNACRFWHFDEAKMAIYGNGAHVGNLRIPSGYESTLRSHPPAASCGDGAVNQAHEECDSTGEVCAGDDMVCSTACTCECGDCDDGNPCTVDWCSKDTGCVHDLDAACLAPIMSLLTDESCGDGVLDAGEECDDGNRDEGDGCSAACTR